MSTKPWDIYAEQLFPSGYGHPLWKPEPNASSGREVFIGDVGWLVEGEFRALFNSMKDAGDAINQAKSVPRDFAVFAPANISIGRSDKITTPIVFSRSITADEGQAEVTADVPSGVPGWRFQTTSDAGAMVMLAPPAVAEDIESNRFISDYMRDHFDSWLEFANTSESWDLALRPEDIVFVCGTLKTTEWALAAFQASTFENKDGVICRQLDSTGNIQISVQIDSQSLPASHLRVGSSGRRDQCLFIHYYKMKRRLWMRVPMQATAGPHQLPPGADDDAMSPGMVRGVSPCEFGSEPEGHGRDDMYDPVNAVLDYILRTSEADIAIASDLDLIALFRDGTFPDDIPAALMELSPAVEIDKHGVGTILIDHSFAETERVGDEETCMNRHEYMPQPAASCYSDPPEVALLGPQSTPQVFPLPACGKECLLRGNGGYGPLAVTPCALSCSDGHLAWASHHFAKLAMLSVNACRLASQEQG